MKNEQLALAWTSEVGGPAAQLDLPPRRALHTPVLLHTAAGSLPAAAAAAGPAQLVAPDGVLDRNFALLGPGDTAVRWRGRRRPALATLPPLPLLPVACDCAALLSPGCPPSCPHPRFSCLQAGEVLLKESMHAFTLWASGRRFCQGLLASFRLLRRQDLLAWGLQAAKGERDVLELEARFLTSSFFCLCCVGLEWGKRGGRRGAPQRRRAGTRTSRPLPAYSRHAHPNRPPSHRRCA